VMERLRRDCPWDRKQTHQSLIPYLVEETYETADAVASGDFTSLREELGDVLMQIAFHSVVAAERGEDGFTIDDVAEGIVDKLVRRHPHVFAEVDVSGAAEVEVNWDAIKKEEKGERGLVEGVPFSQPALLEAAQLVRRARKGGVPEELFADYADRAGPAEDAERELRAWSARFRVKVEEWEREGRG